MGYGLLEHWSLFGQAALIITSLAFMGFFAAPLLIWSLLSVVLFWIVGFSKTFIVAYAAVLLMGYGAAVAISEDVLRPLMMLSPALALALADFITMGIPAAVLFCLFALALKHFSGMAHPPMLVAPFVLFMLFGLLTIFESNDGKIIYIAQTMAKVLPVIACALYLAKTEASNSDD